MKYLRKTEMINDVLGHERDVAICTEDQQKTVECLQGTFFLFHDLRQHIHFHFLGIFVLVFEIDRNIQIVYLWN